jgi:hypothetical protein
MSRAIADMLRKAGRNVVEIDETRDAARVADEVGRARQQRDFLFESEPAPLEHDFLREATLWLAERGVFEWRNNTGVARHTETGQHVRFGIPGGSDLLVVVPPFGRFLGVETKAAKGRQSEKQKTFERAVRRAGGVYALAKTLEDVRRAFEEAQRIPGLDDVISAAEVGLLAHGEPTVPVDVIRSWLGQIRKAARRTA